MLYKVKACLHGFEILTWTRMKDNDFSDEIQILVKALNYQLKVETSLAIRFRTRFTSWLAALLQGIFIYGTLSGALFNQPKFP